MFLPVKREKTIPVVDIVAAMNIDSVPLSKVSSDEILADSEQASVHLLFQASLGRFIDALKRWFLPHLLGGIGVFLLLAYVTAVVLFASWSSAFKWVGILLILVGYSVLAFGYSLFTTCVLALRLACVGWQDFIEGILGLVQSRATNQLVDMHMGLTKTEAKHLVRGSVRDVFASVKQQQTGLPRGMVVLCLGLLAAAVRAVLSAKIMKWSGRTIQIGKLFAGKATLVGAIFLNLHFFVTLLLGLCYSVGIVVLVLNIYFLFLLK